MLDGFTMAVVGKVTHGGVLRTPRPAGAPPAACHTQGTLAREESTITTRENSTEVLCRG
jgi:hypothetical protein